MPESFKNGEVAGKVMGERREDKHGVAMGRIGNRPFWVLNVSIVIRALHQIGAALFLATFLLGKGIELPKVYSYLVYVTGFALVFTEWLRHREIYREFSGIATLVKILLLGAAYHHYLPMTATVVVVFFLASVCSHAPKKVRHRLLY